MEGEVTATFTVFKMRLVFLDQIQKMMPTVELRAPRVTRRQTASKYRPGRFSYLKFTLIGSIMQLPSHVGSPEATRPRCHTRRRRASRITARIWTGRETPPRIYISKAHRDTVLVN